MSEAESKRSGVSTGHASAPYTIRGRDTYVCEGLVSVIVPAYNVAPTIERTISSVLNQTYSKLEVLVVDDGSTDETALLVRRMAAGEPRLRLLQKENGGLVSARNFGIAHSQAEFIAPIDADDLWHSEKIKKQMAIMQSRGDHVGLVYCWARAINEQDQVLFDITPCTLRGNVYAALVIRNFVSSGAPLARKRCVDEIGGYDVTLLSRGAQCCEDLKFNLDIAERYDFDLVPEFLLAYRVHAGSMSTNIDAMLRSHQVVWNEVRRRHPELPRKLFRWACGHQHREFGLARLGEGHIFTGARLLAEAFMEDPFATVRVGMERAIGRRRNASTFGEDTRLQNGAAGSDFFNVESTVHVGPTRTVWTRRRLAFLTGLAVGRRAAFREDHDSADEEKVHAL